MLSRRSGATTTAAGARWPSGSGGASEIARLRRRTTPAPSAAQPLKGTREAGRRRDVGGGDVQPGRSIERAGERGDRGHIRWPRGVIVSSEHRRPASRRSSESVVHGERDDTRRGGARRRDPQLAGGDEGGDADADGSERDRERAVLRCEAAAA